MRASVALCLALTIIPTSARADDDEGFVPLFNGQDLRGWEVKDGDAAAWKASDGMISCSGEKGGWLRTQKQYSDFIVRLEYRIPPGGNSGVGLRFPLVGNPAHDGMEVQILDDAADEYKNLEPAQYTGGIYYQAAAKQGIARPPGEWNSYEIHCVGPMVKVILNGEVVNEVNVDEYTTAKGDYKPLAERPRKGFVGMQSHDTRVDFRNFSIKDLAAEN